jgi:AcrR family transcriptional regulator
MGQPSSSTVAEIARDANVATSLLYFYFQSRDDIIPATLRWIQTLMVATKATTPGETAMAVSNALIDRPAFARILAWLVLEGRGLTEEMGDHPFLRRLTTTLAVGASNGSHTRAGTVVAVLLSHALFADDINRALGRRYDDRRLPEELDGLITTVLDT